MKGAVDVICGGFVTSEQQETVRTICMMVKYWAGKTVGIYKYDEYGKLNFTGAFSKMNVDVIIRLSDNPKTDETLDINLNSVLDVIRDEDCYTFVLDSKNMLTLMKH